MKLGLKTRVAETRTKLRGEKVAPNLFPPEQHLSAVIRAAAMLHSVSSLARSRYPQFPLHAFSQEISRTKTRRRIFLDSSASCSQPSSAGRRASRVAECKLLRTQGWFTANWFVNVAFTSPGTPVCLPRSLSKIYAPVSPPR